MNGAESLVRTLVAGGVEVCFANPGTSEMHFVAALDKVDGMRCILTLFEGVATGAADGYARIAGRPASTLLHLGPGLANGLANMHNAGRASSPMVNIVGDHATYHRRYDAPLTSDIEGAARPFSSWLRTSLAATDIARDGADAIAAARSPPGRVATLVLPADTAWGESGMAEGASVPVPPHARTRHVDRAAIAEAARLLRRGDRAALLLSGAALNGEGLASAGRIAAVSGARLIGQTFNARMECGAGRVSFERLPYPVDAACSMLRYFDTLILVGAKSPVAFFAYPAKPSLLASVSSRQHVLSLPEEDIAEALQSLADELGAPSAPAGLQRIYAAPPVGPIRAEKLGAVLASLLPEQSVVVDESCTTGWAFFEAMKHAAPHDLIHNLGGSIGYAMPVALGAAIAAPQRQVVCLESDGSAMYTLQSLWTQARERTKVVTLLFSNRAYQTLIGELSNVGVAHPGRKVLDMMNLDNPTIDWVSMAKAMGVPAVRAETLEDVARGIRAGIDENGPFLVEVVL